MENNSSNRRKRLRRKKLKRKYLIRRGLALGFLLLIIILLSRACSKKTTKVPDGNSENQRAELSKSPEDEENSLENQVNADNRNGNISLGERTIRVSDISIEYGESYIEEGISKEKRTLYVLEDASVKEKFLDLLKSSVFGEISLNMARDEDSGSYVDISLNSNDHILIKSNDLYKTESGDIDGLYRYIYYVDKTNESQGELKAVFVINNNLKDELKTLLKENNVEGHDMEIGE
ncbi:hypothetical protein [Peptoniphilus raoultii]|uniref:hypothetical protein n=1 Tax=Peptoniphilus raoultii TaxID=1776387 RepID=UPI0008DAC793|nr:hypothetical protein [Peptoniphilus raoultii]